MTKATIKELQEVVDNLRERNSEKIATINKMARDKVVLCDDVSRLHRDTIRMDGIIVCLQETLRAANSAIDTIQATCISVSKPCGKDVHQVERANPADEGILHILSHLRFILR